MAESMVPQAPEAIAELKAAIAGHEVAWRAYDQSGEAITGPLYAAVRAANERIGRSRGVVNEILADRGLFNPRRPIGNDKAMRLLSEGLCNDTG